MTGLDAFGLGPAVEAIPTCRAQAGDGVDGDTLQPVVLLRLVTLEDGEELERVYTLPAGMAESLGIQIIVSAIRSMARSIDGVPEHLADLAELLLPRDPGT